ncbi:MAG: hypothetical protein LQ338_002585 [Usnochroma carphineum]|nr:MAG: hypothetical protein LQ338_002585 [Usnochroma carphineum]
MPSLPSHRSTSQALHAFEPSVNTLSLHERTRSNKIATSTINPSVHKRALYTTVTMANGWSIHYRVFRVLTPAIPALLQLRHFYHSILQEVAHQVFLGEAPVTIVEPYLGEITMQFMAERGFQHAVDWGIIEAFVERMLENTVPMTFMCHISPPGTMTGIRISLWVGKRLRVLGGPGS